MGWTIFTVIDLFVGALFLDLMTTSVPPEKLPRVRAARNVSLVLFAIAVIVLLVQLAHRHGWLSTKRSHVEKLLCQSFAI